MAERRPLQKLVSTHAFARELLTRRNEYVRFWLFGRLSIVWDTNRPVLPPVPTSHLLTANQRVAEGDI